MQKDIALFTTDVEILCASEVKEYYLPCIEAKKIVFWAGVWVSSKK